jgi:cyclopropane-fatty-acyl-phospholipid synthase
MLFRILLKQIIREGALRLIDAKGRSHVIGDGSEPKLAIRLHDPWLDYSLALNLPLRFGEAYMEGRLSIEGGSIRDFMDQALRNHRHIDEHPMVILGLALSRHGRWLKQHNPIGKAQKNVAHHYDLSDELYRRFLDPDRQYSCGYFTTPRDTLEDAQEYKKRHIAAKLLLDRPGLKVLDIGSGWGGLGLYLTEMTGCTVDGVTLSVEQHKVSQERARQAGLDSRARFHLKDYREANDTYDRIVSVGMFEHVGKKNYDEFFQKVRDLLADDGVCLLHSIGDFNEPGPINPFIRKYIFPGADVPTLAEVLPSVERAKLMVTDVEILRLHYAETLKHWYERFQAKRDEVAEVYDERFCRMWELYLSGCEMSFRHQGLMVFQMQITKDINALPVTRDYMFEWEREQSAQSVRAAE